tara:strand:+ start:444 stop:1400 length:957 start_codon:yes stop_codon:yes gene_type:complete
MNKILKVELSPKRYGGRVYEKQIIDLIKDEVKVEKIYLMKYSIILFNIPRFILLFLKFRYFFKGKLFLNDHTCWMAGRNTKSNILILHHIDSSYSPFFSKIYQKFNHFALMINKRRFDKTIVVSSYWKLKLTSLGFNNIHVIYNSFDLSKFIINENEKKIFRTKYFLDDRPIVYLGNALIKKGVIESFKELKEMDVNFVTSGTEKIKLTCLNLNLSYREYLTLLSISDIVITMSKFSEGWNRTAHEATLLETTVIGSGKGGMKELIEKSNQIICPNFQNLKSVVLYVLLNKNNHKPNKLFASSLNLEYFKNEWLKILK